MTDRRDSAKTERSTTAVQDMQDETVQAVRAALTVKAVADNTLRAYTNALARLDHWCGGMLLTDDTLATYLARLWVDGKSLSLASLTVAAVGWHARENDEPSPVGRATRRVLGGIRRTAAEDNRGPRPADAADWRQAEQMAAAAAKDGSLRGMRDAALVSVASDAMLRVSEASALDRDDIAFIKDGVLVCVRRGKTDQKGAGVVLFCGRRAAHWLRRWIDDSGIEDGPLFRQVGKGGKVCTERLGVRSLQDVAKRLAVEAGLEGRITWHSLRIGAAHSLAAMGASLVEMQIAGRWKSPEMPAYYVRGQQAACGPVARLRDADVRQ